MVTWQIWVSGEMKRIEDEVEMAWMNRWIRFVDNTERRGSIS